MCGKNSTDTKLFAKNVEFFIEARKSHSHSLIWLWEIKHENHDSLHELNCYIARNDENPGCAGDGSTQIAFKVLDLLAYQPFLSSFTVSTRRNHFPGTSAYVYG